MPRRGSGERALGQRLCGSCAVQAWPALKPFSPEVPHGRPPAGDLQDWGGTSWDEVRWGAAPSPLWCGARGHSNSCLTGKCPSGNSLWPGTETKSLLPMTFSLHCPRNPIDRAKLGGQGVGAVSAHGLRLCLQCCLSFHHCLLPCANHCPLHAEVVKYFIIQTQALLRVKVSRMS